MTKRDALTHDEMDARIMGCLKRSGIYPCKISVIVLAVYREKYIVELTGPRFLEYKLNVFDLLCMLEVKKLVVNLSHLPTIEKVHLMETSQCVLTSNI